MTANSDQTTMNRGRGIIIMLDSNDLSDSEYFHEMMILVWKYSLVSELYLSNCRIGDHGIVPMVEACLGCSELSSNPSMQVLDVSYNNLTATGLDNFACRLLEVGRRQYSFFSKLHTLRLAGNTLDNVSCIQLANAISQGPLQSLKDLDVARTSCGVVGAMALIECNLSENKQSRLKSLNLFGNGLGSEGFVMLSKTLEGGHPSLETLDLGGNNATEPGVVALLEAVLRRNERQNNLQTLVLGGNQGGENVEHFVQEIKRIHPRLDVARDKPGKQRNSDAPPSTNWIS
jgi:Ran GTPase-activating protein (RanGAP) involved in mRNA processing and transport